MTREIEGLAQAAVLFAVILLATAFGIVLARRLRGRTMQSMADPQATMTKFRELHERGGLSDEEFRTIKAKLARQVRAELAGRKDVPE